MAESDYLTKTLKALMLVLLDGKRQKSRLIFLIALGLGRPTSPTFLAPRLKQSASDSLRSEGSATVREARKANPQHGYPGTY